MGRGDKVHNFLDNLIATLGLGDRSIHIPKDAIKLAEISEEGFESTYCLSRNGCLGFKFL
jgi:hypothetical protein